MAPLLLSSYSSVRGSLIITTSDVTLSELLTGPLNKNEYELGAWRVKQICILNCSLPDDEEA
jgi:hypothetical protein